MNYATTYDNYYKFKEDKSYINSCHISKIKIPTNIIIQAEIKNLDNRYLFFEFPDDYSEEELFYFCMKYSAEKLT